MNNVPSSRELFQFFIQDRDAWHTAFDIAEKMGVPKEHRAALHYRLTWLARRAIIDRRKTTSKFHHEVYEYNLPRHIIEQYGIVPARIPKFSDAELEYMEELEELVLELLGKIADASTKIPYSYSIIARSLRLMYWAEHDVQLYIDGVRDKVRRVERADKNRLKF